MRSSKTRHMKQEKREWHTFSVTDTLTALGSSFDGLTDGEVALRLMRYGRNVLTEHKKVTIFEHIYRQLMSPLTIVLALAFVATLFLGEYVDSSVIFFALAIAVVLGVLQEGKASRAFEKLSHSQTQTAQVLRSGKRHSISSEELVPGDVVVLIGGMQTPADVRIIESKNLSINEASLTGEWMASNKSNEPVPVGTVLVSRYVYCGRIRHCCGCWDG